MDKCLESYKTQEKSRVPVKNMYYYMKKVITGLIIVLIVFSFIFGENLFAELGTSTLMLLIAVVINLFLAGKTDKEVHHNIELKFYDNYLTFYREEMYYTSTVTRREFLTYRNVSRVRYDYRIRRLDMYGDKEGLLYNFNKDGSVPDKPTKIKNIKGTYDSIYTVKDEDIDNIINLFKKYTNCKIEYAHEEDK